MEIKIVKHKTDTGDAKPIRHTASRLHPEKVSKPRGL